MRNAIVISLLAAAGTASAQLNRSFELGDLTGYTIFNGPVSRSTVVDTGLGQDPTHGQWMAHVQAGGLTQQEAANVLDIMSERLADLYVDLGGAGPADGGDYNILAIDVPAGDYRFDFLFSTGDAGSETYLDHAFVVNGARQITLLADAYGLVEDWNQVTVEHPGGRFFFVCANGGDTGVNADLFLDNTRYFDIDNGSFETAGFHEWNVADAGSGNVQVVNQPGGGLPPTTGAWYARIVAGDLDQADAEQILGLEPGRLAELYLELGGTGDAEAGDYSILSQPIGGTSIEFDFAYSTPDAGEFFLDHAFTVDSEGNITMLGSNNDETLTWERVVIDHPGGEFFLVSANGGDTGVPGALFVDTFRDGPRHVSSVRDWNGMIYLGTWSAGGFATYGQVVESERRQRLDNVKFFVEEQTEEPIVYRAYVYEWDGEKIVGAPLFASTIRGTDAEDEGGEAIIIDTPGVVLDKDRCYVAFLSMIGVPAGGFGKLGYTNADFVEGHGVSSTSMTFDELAETPWSTIGQTDLAVEFDFGAIESQVVPNVNAFARGPSSQAMPWGMGGDIRYQQMYNYEQFNGVGGTIESIAFRVNAIGQSFDNVQFHDVQIWLGHADVAIGNMSATFDDNFTADRVLVHDGPLVLSSAARGGFDVVVDIADFEYVPTQGNLLMEIALPDDQPLVPQFDAAGNGFFAGDTAWTDRLFASSIDAPTGLSGGVDGLVTRFNFLDDGAPYDPDCNQDGVYNILDFVCFQLAFEAGDMEIADCDGNGVLNILDFVSFQQAFVEVCN